MHILAGDCDMVVSVSAEAPRATAWDTGEKRDSHLEALYNLHKK